MTEFAMTTALITLTALAIIAIVWCAADTIILPALGWVLNRMIGRI